MANLNDSRDAADPFNLDRFVHAQQDVYELAISEIKGGQKRTHWMWFIFPQIDGLAFSATAKHYAIKSVEEANAYLSHPILGPRLVECAEAVIGVAGRSAKEIFGRLPERATASLSSRSMSVSGTPSVRAASAMIWVRTARPATCAEEPALIAWRLAKAPTPCEIAPVSPMVITMSSMRQPI